MSALGSEPLIAAATSQQATATSPSSPWISSQPTPLIRQPGSIA
uniref:Uncharacterized protein n=1 Tax=Arundo donax TaxID=35708 RepID=A0A0A8YE98_ARUDO